MGVVSNRHDGMDVRPLEDLPKVGVNTNHPLPSVKEDEWVDVGVYENFDSISGISFLPFSSITQTQPYQDYSRKEGYKEALKTMPENVDWAELSKYESQDYTVASQELACTAGGCEVI